jgi:hypothetical protein
MKKLLISLGVLLVVILGGRALVSYMSRSANENTATVRVRTFLNGMKPGGDFQAAFNMWERGDVGALQDMTQDQYNVKVAELHEWLAEREIGDGIEGFEILGATMVAPSQALRGAVVEVSCTIDGQAVKIRAVKDERLAWADRPAAR